LRPPYIYGEQSLDKEEILRLHLPFSSSCLPSFLNAGSGLRIQRYTQITTRTQLLRAQIPTVPQVPELRTCHTPRSPFMKW